MQQSFRTDSTSSICCRQPIMVASPGIAVAQAPPAAKVAPDAGDPWPRIVTSQGATISIYQPQVDTWSGKRAQGLRGGESEDRGKKATDYGVIWFTANTEVDKVNRVVTLTNFDITKQSFPTLAEQRRGVCQRVHGRVALEPDDPAGSAGERPGDFGERGSAEDVRGAEQSAAHHLQHHARGVGVDRRQAGTGPGAGPSCRR